MSSNLPASFVLPVNLPGRGIRNVAAYLHEGAVDAVTLAEPETDPRYFGGDCVACELDTAELEVAFDWVDDALVDLRDGRPLELVQESFARRAEVANLSRYPMLAR